MPSEARHHDVTVEGLRTHYVAAGQGPPILLLHGLGASAIVWRENIDALSMHYAVYALDLPGHGDSDKPAASYTVQIGVRVLIGFLDALGLAQAALVGSSMGGALAVATALEHPQRVSRLVLVDAAGLGREVAPYLRVGSLPLVGEVFNRPWFGMTNKMLRGVFHNKRLATVELEEELERTRSSPGARQAELRILRHGVNLLGVRPHTVFQGRLPALKMPVLLVWGARDTVLPVAHAYAAFRMLSTARLVVYPDCGHWPQMERAAEFNRMVGEFLRGGEDRAPPQPPALWP